MPAGGIGGRELADFRQLLSVHSAGREYHRFRAQWSGFVECVLRAVSVFRLGQEPGGVWRSQSVGGGERHVFPERQLAVWKNTSGVQRFELCEPGAVCAQVRYRDLVYIIALSQQPV